MSAHTRDAGQRVVQRQYSVKKKRGDYRRGLQRGLQTPTYCAGQLAFKDSGPRNSGELQHLRAHGAILATSKYRLNAWVDVIEASSPTLDDQCGATDGRGRLS